MVRIKAKTAWRVIPTRRRGREISQMMGSNTSASNASGQHKTKSMHQPMNRISTFISKLIWTRFNGRSN